ncbi:hypothetical protein [Helicobacter sp. 13S00477-4]|uniref:hypothetical protein n=1 Tax=Helicobacter sp. 13S00477-4 TaxID=1905759 RepID=UPI000BA672BB|nr:hypothetical protein [Helicobacter sp. 13S00477-4]PAF51566.1 hypothetical protein BKH44_05535 [Helicobacter sp. 13S00477-4]
MEQKIQNLIYQSLQNLSDELENELLKQPNKNTKIYGVDGNLDSLALVSLISDIEMGLSDEMGIDITIADEKAMSQRSSPFKDVSTLSAYISKLIDEKTTQAPCQ